MRFEELLTIMECKDYMYVKVDILCHSTSPLPTSQEIFKGKFEYGSELLDEYSDYNVISVDPKVCAMTNESSTIQNKCDNYLKYYGILHIVISNTKM